MGAPAGASWNERRGRDVAVAVARASFVETKSSRRDSEISWAAVIDRHAFDAWDCARGSLVD